MASLNDWSVVDASNSSLGAMIWSEGQLPSTVNNSARNMASQLRYELATNSSSSTAGATTDLGSFAEGLVVLSGNATIGSFGTTGTAGLRRKVKVTGTPTISCSTAGAIQGPTNSAIVCQANDTFEAVCEASDVWRIWNYQRADGTPFKFGQMAQATIKGRASGAGAGEPTDLTAAQVRAIVTLPYFSAYLSANQTGGVAAKILFDTEESDSDGWYDNATDHRFTPLLAGKYRVSAAMIATTTAFVAGTTVAAIRIFKNGSSLKEQSLLVAANQTAVGISAIVDFNGSTDYVEIFGEIGGTTPLIVGGTAPRFTWFDAQYIGP
jgi:hypothetical protein